MERLFVSEDETGKMGSAAEIARDEGLPRSYVTRAMRLTFLASRITEPVSSTAAC